MIRLSLCVLTPRVAANVDMHPNGGGKPFDATVVTPLWVPICRPICLHPPRLGASGYPLSMLRMFPFHSSQLFCPPSNSLETSLPCFVQTLACADAFGVHCLLGPSWGPATLGSLALSVSQHLNLVRTSSALTIPRSPRPVSFVSSCARAHILAAPHGHFNSSVHLTSASWTDVLERHPHSALPHLALVHSSLHV